MEKVFSSISYSACTDVDSTEKIYVSVVYTVCAVGS